jgi:uncharacterized membrane protein
MISRRPIKAQPRKPLLCCRALAKAIPLVLDENRCDGVTQRKMWCDPFVRYLLLKYLHVIGATVILGTGSGIAFFMLMAHLSRDAAFVARTAAVVVVADIVFTATAVVAQPLTGYLLARDMGMSLSDGWLVASLILYGVAGAFWLPVVWMQVRMRDLAAAAALAGEPLPPSYNRLFRWWFVFGFPGFGSVMLIMWLMIAKPVL